MPMIMSYADINGAEESKYLQNISKQREKSWETERKWGNRGDNTNFAINTVQIKWNREKNLEKIYYAIFEIIGLLALH